MRRLELYIKNQHADIDKDGLVLMTYTLDDLTSPNVVKNSYSQRITLPSTPANDRIFENQYRPDATPEMADPRKRMPFEIFDELGAVVVSGYAKLETIKRSKGVYTYEVSLYGGLGGFLYGLMYDDKGDKKSLASLHYIQAEPSDTELDFRITKDAVLEAWQRINEEARPVESEVIWDVLNFAPAYNGIPSDGFTANKGVFTPSLANQPTTQEGYTVKEEQSIATLGTAVDEWAAKDLRSYLQRPVISLKAILEAIQRPENNGGYKVNLPCLENMGVYADLWCTLPMFSKSTIEREKGGESNRVSITETTRKLLATTYLRKPRPSGVTTDITANVTLEAYTNDYTAATLTYKSTTNVSSLMFIELVAYNKIGKAISAAPVQAVGELSGFANLKTYAEAATFEPIFGDKYAPRPEPTGATWKRVLTPGGVKPGYYKAQFPITISIQDAGEVDYVSVYMTACRCVYGQNPVDSGNSRIELYDTSTPHIVTSVYGLLDVDLKWVNDKVARSGAKFTKKSLLSGTATPADYLLSFCKYFGLHIYGAADRKEITIATRSQFFTGELVDLSDRVDHASPITIKPTVYDKKWIAMHGKSEKGDYVEDYAAEYGQPYGSVRFDTGNEHDNGEEKFMDKVLFTDAASIQEHGPYYNILQSTTRFTYPSPFLDGGDYSLWNPTTGEVKQFPILWRRDDVSVEYYNEGARGFDAASTAKAQLHGKDGKPLKGENVLLFHNPATNSTNYRGLKVSDDTPLMLSMNEGKPCWSLDLDFNGLTIPNFSRFVYAYDSTARAYKVSKSLEFSNPQVIEAPTWIWDAADNTVPMFPQFWEKWLKDRTALGVKVFRCKVSLKGLRVGVELQRKFFYFDGAVWILNKITNYSITTEALTDCEFIKVSDLKSYRK